MGQYEYHCLGDVLLKCRPHYHGEEPAGDRGALSCRLKWVNRMPADCASAEGLAPPSCSRATSDPRSRLSAACCKTALPL